MASGYKTAYAPFTLCENNGYGDKQLSNRVPDAGSIPAVSTIRYGVEHQVSIFVTDKVFGIVLKLET